MKNQQKQNTSATLKNKVNAKSSSNDHIAAPHTKMLEMSDERRKKIQETSITIMKRALSVLQIFAISQFGCSARRFQEHMTRKAAMQSASKSGYVTPLSNLQAAIDQIMSLHLRLTDIGGLHPDSEDEMNLPLSSTDKRASWKRSNSVTTPSRRRRNSSICSTASNLHEKPQDIAIQEDLIKIVRGDFFQALKELMQHGLFESFQSSALSTGALVGCIP